MSYRCQTSLPKHTNDSRNRECGYFYIQWVLIMVCRLTFAEGWEKSYCAHDYSSVPGLHFVYMFRLVESSSQLLSSPLGGPSFPFQTKGLSLYNVVHCFAWSFYCTDELDHLEFAWKSQFSPEDDSGFFSKFPGHFSVPTDKRVNSRRDDRAQ